MVKRLNVESVHGGVLGHVVNEHAYGAHVLNGVVVLGEQSWKVETISRLTSAQFKFFHNKNENFAKTEQNE